MFSVQTTQQAWLEQELRQLQQYRRAIPMRALTESGHDHPSLEQLVAIYNSETREDLSDEIERLESDLDVDDGDVLEDEISDDDDSTDQPPIQRSHMHISLQPQNPEARLANAKPWLTRILTSPTLSGYELPRDLKGYIYIDDIPYQLARGSWQSDGSGVMYVGGTSSQIEPLTRLAIISCIANLTGAIDDPAIVRLIEAKLVTTISDSIRTVYHGFVRSDQSPSRLAIDNVNSRVAAEIGGRWLLTSGAPAEVNETWTVMDF